MIDEPATPPGGEPPHSPALPLDMPATDVPPPTRLARNAGVLFLGNMGSRILGLVREMVIAYYFGASGQVRAFRVAAQVPTLLYEFLVGGMLSAALVPVLVGVFLIGIYPALFFAPMNSTVTEIVTQVSHFVTTVAQAVP